MAFVSFYWVNWLKEKKTIRERETKKKKGGKAKQKETPLPYL